MLDTEEIVRSQKETSTSEKKSEEKEEGTEVKRRNKSKETTRKEYFEVRSNKGKWVVGLDSSNPMNKDDGSNSFNNVERCMNSMFRWEIGLIMESSQDRKV